MGKLAFLSLALLSLQAVFVHAEEPAAVVPENVEDTLKDLPKVSVDVSTTFPDSVFGVKLVNGRPTHAEVKFKNLDSEPVTVTAIGGSLWTLTEPAQSVRNLTTTRYGVDVEGNSEETVVYTFATELLPQDLGLNLAAMVLKKDGVLFTLPAYNGTVSVVEPEMSIFDPQVIFLYMFVLASFVGASYFFYTLWIAPYFPQKRKPAKTQERVKKSLRQQTGTDSGDQAPETPAVAKTYDAEWIPAHHIQRPEPRKVKSGSGRAKPRA